MDKLIEFLKYFITITLIIYFIDWFGSGGYKLLKGVDFETINSQYHIKWTWLGMAVIASFFRVYRKKT